MKKTCRECGTEFILSQGEIDFYKSKNFSLPERCKACRDKRKNNKKEVTSQPSRKKSEHNQRNKTTQMDMEQPVVHRAHTSPSSGFSLESSALMKFVLPVILCILALLLARAPSTTLVDSSSYTNSPGSSSNSVTTTTKSYSFRSDQYLLEHFNKHGSLLGFVTKESYLAGANAVIKSSSAFSRTQSDGDTAYFLQSSNEFVVLSTDGYIRTYFKPTDGIDYFYRQ